MDPQLFETLGKYAGLAGISVGVVLVIFRQLLKLQIFSRMVGTQTYRLLQQLRYLTFAIGVIGIAAWAFVTMKENSSYSITGHVVDGKTKKSIADAEITLSGRSESARTDGAGNFALSFTNAPSGSIHLFISKDGYAAFDRNASVGQNIEAELLLLDQSPPRDSGPAPIDVSLKLTPEFVPKNKKQVWVRATLTNNSARQVSIAMIGLRIWREWTTDTSVQTSPENLIFSDTRVKDCPQDICPKQSSRSLLMPMDLGIVLPGGGILTTKGLVPIIFRLIYRRRGSGLRDGPLPVSRTKELAKLLVRQSSRGPSRSSATQRN